MQAIIDLFRDVQLVCI